jgi:hypothetical protein
MSGSASKRHQPNSGVIAPAEKGKGEWGKVQGSAYYIIQRFNFALCTLPVVLILHIALIFPFPTVPFIL